ncbi:MAG: endopeptidase La [Bacteroidaceae bacterium]|nr:endopeptidase La [Bacteroidaceae bacterium]
MFENNKKTFSFVAEVSGETEKLMHASYGGEMPIITLRDNIFFPGTVSPITIGRKHSLKTLHKLERTDGMVALLTQKTPDVDNPQTEDLYPIGVVAKLVHSMKMPDGTFNALFQAFNRVQIEELRMVNGAYEGTIVTMTDQIPGRMELPEYKTMLAILKERTSKLMNVLDDYPDELTQYITNMEPTTFMLNTICSYLPLTIEQKYELLSCPSELVRLQQAIQFANNIIELMQLKRKIENKTRSDLDQQQREYFLRQQVQNIQSELGDKDESSVRQEDVNNLKSKATSKHWSKQTAETFDKELAKLNRINIQSPDYNVQLQYLQTVVGLPWNECTRDNTNIAMAEKKLNRDHYGMEKVKERILEHLAVLKMRKDRQSPIICLYGPPGVGKTSLGKSIAEALGRKYVRVSLGGVHDESEIRGHRRTYIGAMPGRIIQGMQRAGSSNPVFILDEIDKLTLGSVHGDPSSALLEVLDPEQNVTFHDNYVDLDYDLSKVMFIATANDTGTIPRPLLDRMELIEVDGYITEEKIEIAKRHLVPKNREKNGLKEHTALKVAKPALEFIIERYTRESGVRGLEKQIDKLFRRVALRVAKGEMNEDHTISKEEAEVLLGKPIFSRDTYQGNDYAGVVTGLAWTSVGGEILFIETSLSKGKGSKLTLTGNLGDIMKESALLALEYIRAHVERLDIDSRIFENYNLHVHVPEGAVPKDGPSAGITMATSIASALTQRKVRAGLAMTGEITLRGKVLPVGGIREKILAAKRAGIKDIILCKENKKDIEEIPSEYLKGLTFHYASDIQDVLDFALLKEKVANPITFTFDEEKEKEK